MVGAGKEGECMMNDEEFDNILRQRHMELPSEDLAERVSYKAMAANAQKRQLDWRMPAVIMASILVLGLFVLPTDQASHKEIFILTEGHQEALENVFYYPDESIF